MNYFNVNGKLCNMENFKRPKCITCHQLLKTLFSLNFRVNVLWFYVWNIFSWCMVCSVLTTHKNMFLLIYLMLCSISMSILFLLINIIIYVNFSLFLNFFVLINLHLHYTRFFLVFFFFLFLITYIQNLHV